MKGLRPTKFRGSIILLNLAFFECAAEPNNPVPPTKYPRECSALDATNRVPPPPMKSIARFKVINQVRRLSLGEPNSEMFRNTYPIPHNSINIQPNLEVERRSAIVQAIKVRRINIGKGRSTFFSNSHALN